MTSWVAEGWRSVLSSQGVKDFIERFMWATELSWFNVGLTRLVVTCSWQSKELELRGAS